MCHPSQYWKQRETSEVSLVKKLNWLHFYIPELGVERNDMQVQCQAFLRSWEVNAVADEQPDTKNKRSLISMESWYFSFSKSATVVTEKNNDMIHEVSVLLKEYFNLNV